MSFRDRVERLTDAHYVLPRTGAMRVDVHAFLSPALLAQTDEQLWRQAAQAAAYPGIVGFYLMPDTHVGYGIPVGGVAVTDDVIIQAGSGYDISCGVLYLKVPELSAADGAGTCDRRSRRLNFSHSKNTYAVFCVKNKKKKKNDQVLQQNLSPDNSQLLHI